MTPYEQNHQWPQSDVKSQTSQISASKQIGAHLIQLGQNTAIKPKLENSGGFDLFQLLRLVGEAYQSMSDYKCA